MRKQQKHYSLVVSLLTSPRPLNAAPLRRGDHHGGY
nr:MAG TPA: hypothetical protein [Caudoviricetes sp.]